MPPISSTTGEYEKAIDYFKEAIGLLKRLGHHQDAALLTYNLAETYRMMGKYDESLKCLEETLAVTEKLNDRLAGARTQCTIGVVYLNLGQYERAISWRRAKHCRCTLRKHPAVPVETPQ